MTLGLLAALLIVVAGSWFAGYMNRRQARKDWDTYGITYTPRWNATARDNRESWQR